MSRALTKRRTDVALTEQKQITSLLDNVRDDIRDNPYLVEAVRVLPVGGYRSAIGSVWNAVVDDLRNKVMHRSIEAFNKATSIGRTITTYEDFQNHVTDDQLIDGAYKIGVITWEGSKILKQAKVTRHVFDGHPKSSEPSAIKVLAMLDDCIKYVLSQPYPSQIIDISAYLTQMAESDYDRNEIAIDNALSELPESYKNELANRFFTTYVHEGTSSILKSNIEFALPILWAVLPKEVKHQIVRRVDQKISAGNTVKTGLAFDFVKHVDGQRFLSKNARAYLISPLVKKLKKEQDNWPVENAMVKALEPYAAYIPENLLSDYVSALTMTYVGYMGSSIQYRRTDFYADGAAPRIPGMFRAFDDKAAAAFVETVRTNSELKKRVSGWPKMN